MAQALGMLGRLEDLAAIGALALEDGAGVMQRVGQNMRLGVAPGDELAVVPDPAVAIVEMSGPPWRAPWIGRFGFDFIPARIK